MVGIKERVVGGGCAREDVMRGVFEDKMVMVRGKRVLVEGCRRLR